jgi:multiple sugar transport system permease protein
MSTGSVDPLPAEPAALASAVSPARPRRRRFGDLREAFFFLTPNLLGVLAFVIFPVIFSLAMAFTNWDLKQHNQFSDESIKFVGLRNFIDLFTEGQFLRFLGNTLFFMMGIPLSVIGSLAAAMLLSTDARPKRKKLAVVLATVFMFIGLAMMVASGLGRTGLAVLIVGLFGMLLGGGLLVGSTLYRTVFYTPCFVAGVATMILWKRLYNPQQGPVNTALQPVLDTVATSVNALPVWVSGALPWVMVVGFAFLLIAGLLRFERWFRDGDLGRGAAVLPILVLHLPVLVACIWDRTAPWTGVWLGGVAAAWAGALITFARGRDERFAARPAEGFGTSIVFGLLVMTAMFIALGFFAVLQALPTMAADGLEPPRWLTEYHWAKPALMIMGFWAAVGSNNMLLYIAALSGVAPQLYEAADIDGAGRLARFWNVTWPQLAPTTFFILVMSVIGGLQGGFEMAKVMTGGGPAGATTTLSYFIYIEGFETVRLGFASAVAWALFAIILAVTLFNWRFGNQYVND